LAKGCEGNSLHVFPFSYYFLAFLWEQFQTTVASDIAGPSTYVLKNNATFIDGLKKLLDIPVVNPLPWLRKTASKMANKNKPILIADDKVDEKYNAYKKFDIVDDHSDHYYSKPALRHVAVVGKVTILACFLFVLCHLSSVLSCLLHNHQKSGQILFSTSGKS
jgi:hypothetical protein